MNRKILVVDDEEIQANIIADILQKERYNVKKAYSAEEAIRIIFKEDFSVLIADLKMPGMGGMGLLKAVKEKGIPTNVIIMTAYGTIETAVKAMKIGAFDYITKPFSKDELLINVERAIHAYNLYFQNVKLKEELEYIYEEKKLIGKSKAMQHVHDLIIKVAENDSVNVLITGESGTGKELVAREIHERSSRADMPFVPINCSAIPESLLESEIFGYEKGAFTGAVSSREGKFKRANGGTVFLDEIADMPLSMQVKLLRVIQDREVTPVGGDEPISVNIRIISATNKNIEELIKKGQFRDDLFYRLNVIPIHIPPLRERKEDIPLLVQHIINRLNIKLKKNVTSLPDEIMKKLCEYSFPGNVRELENMLERAFIISGSDMLNIQHFPMLNNISNISELKNQPFNLKEAVKQAKKEVEKKIIEKTLKQTNWNRLKAAKILGVDYKTLRNKLKELNIVPLYSGERSNQ